MGINVAGDFNDTNSNLFEQEVISVNTTQTEAICSATDIDERQFVRIYNNSNQKVYFGPDGVTTSTGEPIFKKQFVEIAIKSQSVFLIVDNGTADVIVTDIG